MIIEQTTRGGPCPACGVLTSAVKERPLRRLKDLPASGQTVELWWRKRRLVCGEAVCRQHSFTQVCAAVRPRGRVTERLRHRVAKAIAESNRAVSDVARRVPGVVADRAQGACGVAAAVAARARADEPARDR